MEGEFDETAMLSECQSQAERQRLLADLFAKHRERLKRMVKLRLDQRLQARVDPSDVVQETYLEAWKRLDDFLRKPTVPVFIWMRFLAGQKLCTLHRYHLGAQVRNARKEISLYRGPMPQATSEALAAQLLGQETSPSEAAIRAERKIQLQEALNRMDPTDREVLALRHFEQLSSAEVAQVLGIKDAAVRQRYFRALERLKRILVSMPGGMGEDQK